MKFNPAKLRKTVLKMAYAGSTVHIGCSFSIIELLSVLYEKFLRYPNNSPTDEFRDYFILSKGHGVMAQYACILELGWICDDDILNYFTDGSNLKGLADSRVMGIEATSGSLGHGFSVGAGLAMGAKLRNTEQKTYVLVGDGEVNEGPIWESALFANHHRLSNLMVIVDENGFQAMGATKDIIELGSIKSKFESFGFDAIAIDGHDVLAIENAIDELWNGDKKKPKALIAKTVKGKGVSFMENDNSWHYTRLTLETYQQALTLINKDNS